MDHMKKPRGQRIDDPPPAEQPVKFRAALAARKYPVQIAVSILLVVLCIPVVLLLRSNHELRSSNAELRSALITSSTSRRATIGVFCGVINQNAKANSGQNQYLKRIILSSVRASRAFEKTYTSLGLPDYAKRLAQAKRIVHGLDRYDIRPLDCQKFAQEATRSLGSLKAGR